MDTLFQPGCSMPPGISAASVRRSCDSGPSAACPTRALASWRPFSETVSVETSMSSGEPRQASESSLPPP